MTKTTAMIMLTTMNQILTSRELSSRATREGPISTAGKRMKATAPAYRTQAAKQQSVDTRTIKSHTLNWNGGDAGG
jgi:hypothetical protein